MFSIKSCVELYSIKRRLQQKLFAAIALLARSGAISSQPTACGNAHSISMYRLKDTCNFTYRCGIALKVAGQYPRSRPEIAAALFAVLEETDSFNFRVRQNGWLDCQVRDRAVADWLQSLLLAPLPSPTANSLSPPDFFPLQYAHARCCSLLRLGQRQKLIQLHVCGTEYPPRPWLAPSPVPWLSAAASLQFSLPAERHLVALLLDTIDRTDASQSPPNWLKAAMLLQEAVLNFERDCRIFGRVPPELAQARLGLCAIAQRVLAWLLQVELGVLALPHL